MKDGKKIKDKRQKLMQPESSIHNKNTQMRGRRINHRKRISHTTILQHFGS